MFNEDKFQQLSPLQQLKKLSYHLRQSAQNPHHQSVKIYPFMIEYLNKKYDYRFTIPQNKVEIQLLYKSLAERIEEGDPYQDQIMFDSPKKNRTTYQNALILDNIRSPFNVGSLFRTSEALGISKIILLGITPSPNNNSKIARTAKGSQVDYIHYDEAITFSKTLNVEDRIISIEKTSTSQDISSIKKSLRLASQNGWNYFILGNEEFGISQECLNLSHAIYHIPMLGQKNSLNVSVAGGIFLYQVLCHFYQDDLSKISNDDF